MKLSDLVIPDLQKREQALLFICIYPYIYVPFILTVLSFLWQKI